MKNNNWQSLIKKCAYLYLLLGYATIIYLFSYYVREAVKPISWAIITALALVGYFVYLIINHLLIKRVISKKILIGIELLLLLTLFVLWWSDIMYETS